VLGGTTLPIAHRATGQRTGKIRSSVVDMTIGAGPRVPPGTDVERTSIVIRHPPGSGSV